MAEKFFDTTKMSSDRLPKTGDHYNEENGTYDDAVQTLLSSICFGGCKYIHTECKPETRPTDEITKGDSHAYKIEFLQQDDSSPPPNCPLRGASIGFYLKKSVFQAKIIR